MEKLVVSYTHGDGCTFSCDENVPVEYESAEQLTVDIETAALEFLRNDAARSLEMEAHGRCPEKQELRTKWFEDYRVMHARWKKIDEEFELLNALAKIRIHVIRFVDGGVFEAPTIRTLDEWFDAGLYGEL